MFESNNIEGIDILRKEIPDRLQNWSCFGSISQLHYKKIFDDEIYFDYINCIELLLTCTCNRYTIKLSLFNVNGTLSFNMTNGFYSGFAIDDLSGLGYEKHNGFRIYSFEPDIDFEIYCEKIKAELVQEES